MAGLGRRVFVAGEVLTSANVNGYLMDQSIMVFSDATDRDSEIPTPSDGMFVYQQDTNSLFFYNGSASAWTPFSAGAKGGGTDQVFYENDQVVTTSYEISASANAVSAGPIEISPSASVTVPAGSNWVIV
jgi:hypothetical protein